MNSLRWHLLLPPGTTILFTMKLLCIQTLVLLLGSCVVNAAGPTNSTVVVVQATQAVDGLRVNSNRVTALLNRGIMTLTGTTSPRDAWRQFASSNDVVGIKITAEPGPLLATHRPLIEAIVNGIRATGVPAANIHVFDHDPTKIREAGMDGLATAIINGTGWDADSFYTQNLVGKLIWGDLLFQKADDDLSTQSHLPRVLRRCTKLINVAVLRDHDATGIAGCLHNLSLGMVDNTRRFEIAGPPTDRAIAEINALPAVRQKAVLHVLDALTVAYTGNGTLKARYSTPAGILFLGTDPVAVDTLGLELLDAQRKENGLPTAAEHATHIAVAARVGLGQANRDQIQVLSNDAGEHEQK
jgi:uncharacterized protein (DUF362 family)